MSIETAGTMLPLIAQRKQKPVALRRVFQFSSPTPKNRLIGRSATADPAAFLDKAMQMHYLLQTAKAPIFQEAAMTALAQEVSKLTDRYQTTVPAGVRKQLKLGKGDQIRYCIEPSGRVYIEPMRSDGDDPALGAFLDFVEADIKAHPDRIRAFDGALHGRLAALVGEVEVDLDATLSLEDE